MNKTLLSIEQLLNLWKNKTYSSLTKLIQRGKLTKVVWLNKREALKKGLLWKEKGGGGKGGKRPFINIQDPAIPNDIKIKYHQRFINIEDETIKTPPAADRGKALLLPESSATLSIGEQGFGLAPLSLKRGRDVGTVPATFLNQLSKDEIELELYSSAPGWARKRVDNHSRILKAAEYVKGKISYETFRADWNNKHPECKAPKYSRFMELKSIYAKQGILGLLPKYGKTAGKSKIRDEWFEYFKKIYLQESAPSLYSSWIASIGCARTINPQFKLDNFPSSQSFLRRLKREIPEDAIYMARYGKQAWNRKHGNYINRDYSNLKPGECYVSDHAQVDAAVILPNGKLCFPWITAWRDFKTGKFIGWLYHPEPPNSDHIFQSFYCAVKEWGLPSDVYIDNGKDYRCRDFAGGRKSHKVIVDKAKTTSMLGLLSIMPHFSLPYNPQSKSIERDFLRNKEWFSKHVPGYRGGHIKERPEKLKEEIKNGNILALNEFVNLMDDFIVNVFNKMPSNGKVLKGMCPDELWEKEAKEIKRVSTDALKLFCMRTSRAVTIGRNGVRDSEIGFSYWAEWMSGMKGVKVYLRRDIKSYQEAWVFRAENDEHLGKAYLAEMVPALARTDVEKAQLKKLMAHKKQGEKITKSFIEMKDIPSASDVITHMKAGVETLNKMRGYEPEEKKKVKITRLANTSMDKVIAKDKQMQKEGTIDLSMILPAKKKKQKIHLFECEKEEDEKYGKQEASGGNV